MPIKLIGLDADDTLWHHETFFREAQRKFCALLAPFAPSEVTEERLAETERRNLRLYGYGAKGYTLSLMETALEVTRHRLSGAAMGEILAAGRELLRHPVEPLPGVAEALDELGRQARLVLITKGDLFHQESKLAASGLGGRFAGVEIVSEKAPDVYGRIFARYGASPLETVMAGNSVRSDILPVIEAGGYAALIPYPLAWAHEVAAMPAGHPRFRELTSLRELPGWVASIP